VEGEQQDEWQQLVTTHRDSERTSKLEEIKKQGRRSNRVLGAAFMFVGILGFVISGGWTIQQLGNQDVGIREVKAALAWAGGSLFTVYTGFVIWKGRYR
jgi:hypothetical protein